MSILASAMQFAVRYLVPHGFSSLHPTPASTRAGTKRRRRANALNAPPGSSKPAETVSAAASSAASGQVAASTVAMVASQKTPGRRKKAKTDRPAPTATAAVSRPASTSAIASAASPGTPYTANSTPLAADSVPAASAAAAVAASPSIAQNRPTMFYRAPSSSDVDRLRRALAQRLFLIDWRELAPLQREYHVLGATGNVYTVTIGTFTSCTCPDALMSSRCKHVYFVLFRVLKAGGAGAAAAASRSISSTLLASNAVLFQEVFLPEQLKAMFQGAAAGPIDASVTAASNIQSAFQAATGHKPQNIIQKPVTGPVERKPLAEDDACPVCCESLTGAEETVWCRTQCGKSVHRSCFRQWSKASRRGRAASAANCVYCRAEWTEESESAAQVSAASSCTEYRWPTTYSSNGSYVNLAAHSVAHRGRDDPYSDPDLYYNAFSRYESYNRRRRRQRRDLESGDDDDDDGVDEDDHESTDGDEDENSEQ